MEAARLDREGETGDSGKDTDSACSPCWILRNCPEALRNQCPAYFTKDKPCWEIEDTLCHIVMESPKTCEICTVFLSRNNKSGSIRTDNSENSNSGS